MLDKAHAQDKLNQGSKLNLATRRMLTLLTGGSVAELLTCNREAPL